MRVAPRAGAWIETDMETEDGEVSTASLLAQERGLKLMMNL